jgi:hypothetical protein
MIDRTASLFCEDLKSRDYEHAKIRGPVEQVTQLIGTGHLLFAPPGPDGVRDADDLAREDWTEIAAVERIEVRLQ